MKRKISGILMLLASIALAGCAGHRPLDPPRAEILAACEAVPLEKRQRVHIFMMNGMTIVPHIYGSLNGIEGYIQSLGFPQPHTATHYYQSSFETEIRKLHQADQDAKFVLVGFSIGGGVVLDMAQNLDKDSIAVDLLVYVDAHTFTMDLEKYPGNVRRVVNVYSDGSLMQGHAMQGAENHSSRESGHLGLARDVQTLEIMARELAAVAASFGSPVKSAAP